MEWSDKIIPHDNSKGSFYGNASVHYKIDKSWLDIRFVGTYVTKVELSDTDVIFTLDMPVTCSSDGVGIMTNASSNELVPFRVETNGNVRLYDRHTTSGWLTMATFNVRLPIAN